MFSLTEGYREARFLRVAAIPHENHSTRHHRAARRDTAQLITVERSGARILISGYRKLTWPCFILHSDYYIYTPRETHNFVLSASYIRAN